MPNVLVIAPHPDDESIGCGGALRLHSLRGERIHAIFLTSGEAGLPNFDREQAWRTREAEAEQAASVLGIASLTFLRQPDGRVADHAGDILPTIAQAIVEHKPDVIYTPHPQDAHADHQAAASIVASALANQTSALPNLRGYEIWTPLVTFDQVEDITSVIDDKMRAIRCHHSQVADLAYDRAIAGLNQYRGAIATRSAYAEVFRSTS